MWWRAQVFGQQTKQKYYGNGYLGGNPKSKLCQN